MLFRHKNKTLATLLATVFGGIGLHRFYLRGASDKWGWLHVTSVPLSGLAIHLELGHQVFFQAAPMLLSILAGFLEALVLGLMPDDQWDQRFNPDSGQTSVSNWPLALVLVLTLGVGATALIGVIARSFDLLFTGGAFG